MMNLTPNKEMSSGGGIHTANKFMKGVSFRVANLGLNILTKTGGNSRVGMYSVNKYMDKFRAINRGCRLNSGYTVADNIMLINSETWCSPSIVDKTLLDSGAVCSLIRLDLAVKHGLPISETSGKITLRSATNSKLKIIDTLADTWPK